MLPPTPIKITEMSWIEHRDLAIQEMVGARRATHETALELLAGAQCHLLLAVLKQQDRRP